MGPATCQLAPTTTPTASTRPRWSSEMTSCTPDRPRGLRSFRNATYPAPSSTVTTSRPSTSRSPSELTPDRDDRGDRHDAPALETELADELVDPAGRDARQVAVGDDRHERPLGPPAWLQQPLGEVAALVQARDGEVDAVGARVPTPHVVAVSGVGGPRCPPRRRRYGPPPRRPT